MARRRARPYRTLDGGIRQHDGKVPWYWRILALGSAVIILGGFLILPVTFDDDPGLRIAKSALGIFAIALLTAGFSFTALLSFLFQADAVFLPSLLACALGLLTVFYDFLISSKFTWNVPALLTVVASAVSTIVYAGLLIYTYRRINLLKSSGTYGDVRGSANMPLRPASFGGSSMSTWQEPTFYENYNRNMFPSSIRETQPAQPQGAPQGYNPNEITEEEMQRQQMLMLLLHREQPPTPDPSQSTFRIDWQQGREEEEGSGTPVNGYYAPQPQTAYPPQSALPPETAYPSPGLNRQWTGELRPWDGVWRGGPPQPRGRASSSIQAWERAASRERREARRREIEGG
ncbi:hypothetical protein LTR86_000852 [Recurvomyces mirabilis]|nr:hypothetical protein LTR86_000852 [Recurvomyces mirabilis]